MTETIRWDKDADGIVVLTMDDPNQSANTMNRDYAASMAAMVARLEAEKDEAQIGRAIDEAGAVVQPIGTPTVEADGVHWRKIRIG